MSGERRTAEMDSKATNRWTQDELGGDAAEERREGIDSDAPVGPTRADYAPTGAGEKAGLFATPKRTATEFSEDNLADWAAALTYYGLSCAVPGADRAEQFSAKAKEATPESAEAGAQQLAGDRFDRPREGLGRGLGTDLG
jgi:hypothetical protein